MLKGIGIVGDRVRHKFERQYTGVEADVAVFYGLAGNLKRVFRDYPAAGKTAVYIDLGYWGRKPPRLKFGGHHKISVNSRHPTAYFQRFKHDDSRIRVFGITPGPWHSGSSVLVAGMGPKAAIAEGMQFQQWDRASIADIKRSTKLPIIYRPKPSGPSRPIHGTILSSRDESLDAVLAISHAVVTHHSNVAVDALVAGVPVFCVEGVAAPMAFRDFSMIDNPPKPEGREQLLADIAWCQWSVEEMGQGLPWRHLKNEGVVP